MLLEQNSTLGAWQVKNTLSSNRARFAWFLSSSVLSIIVVRFVSMATQILLARVMGPSDFGIYTSLFALLSPATIAASFGLDVWLLQQSNHPHNLHKAIGRSLSLRLYACSLVMAVSVIVLSIWRSEFSMVLLCLAAVSLTGDLLITTTDSALRSQIRSQATTILQGASALLICIPILFAWYYNYPFSVEYAIWIRTFGISAGVCGAWWMIRNHWSIQWQPQQWMKIINQAKIFFASEILANITLRADLTLIALLLTTDDTALYSPALLFINTTFLVPQIAAQILIPIVIKYDYVTSRLYKVVRLSYSISIFYGMIWFIIFFSYSNWLIDIFYGQEYAKVSLLIKTMCLIPLLKSLNFVSTSVMVARKSQLLRTKLQIWGALFAILANVMLLPVFGVTAAAYVNFGTELILTCSYAFGAYKVI